ncbi:hypothetical protein CSUI_002650 [Cystoisospora suis]|uniref:Uncharacterized protein n=1 Tax=Cystoisospora suis TaxID=483139 RepID=A0A2C6L792_9APIC|nr:hypothetical protein CSUI_002650 [Cystoisospora suis]
MSQQAGVPGPTLEPACPRSGGAFQENDPVGLYGSVPLETQSAYPPPIQHPAHIPSDSPASPSSSFVPPLNDNHFPYPQTQSRLSDVRSALQSCQMLQPHGHIQDHFAGYDGSMLSSGHPESQNTHSLGEARSSFSLSSFSSVDASGPLLSRQPSHTGLEDQLRAENSVQPQSVPESAGQCNVRKVHPLQYGAFSSFAGEPYSDRVCYSTSSRFSAAETRDSSSHGCSDLFSSSGTSQVRASPGGCSENKETSQAAVDPLSLSLPPASPPPSPPPPPQRVAAALRKLGVSEVPLSYVQAGSAGHGTGLLGDRTERRQRRGPSHSKGFFKRLQEGVKDIDPSTQRELESWSTSSAARAGALGAARGGGRLQDVPAQSGGKNTKSEAGTSEPLVGGSKSKKLGEFVSHDGFTQEGDGSFQNTSGGFLSPGTPGGQNTAAGAKRSSRKKADSRGGQRSRKSSTGALNSDGADFCRGPSENRQHVVDMNTGDDGGGVRDFRIEQLGALPGRLSAGGWGDAVWRVKWVDSAWKLRTAVFEPGPADSHPMAALRACINLANRLQSAVRRHQQAGTDPMHTHQRLQERLQQLLDSTPSPNEEERSVAGSHEQRVVRVWPIGELHSLQNWTAGASPGTTWGSQPHPNSIYPEPGQFPLATPKLDPMPGVHGGSFLEKPGEGGAWLNSGRAGSLGLAQQSAPGLPGDEGQVFLPDGAFASGQGVRGSPLLARPAGGVPLIHQEREVCSSDGTPASGLIFSARPGVLGSGSPPSPHPWQGSSSACDASSRDGPYITWTKPAAVSSPACLPEISDSGSAWAGMTTPAWHVPDSPGAPSPGISGFQSGHSVHSSMTDLYPYPSVPCGRGEAVPSLHQKSQNVEDKVCPVGPGMDITTEGDGSASLGIASGACGCPNSAAYGGAAGEQRSQYTVGQSPCARTGGGPALIRAATPAYSATTAATARWAAEEERLLRDVQRDGERERLLAFILGEDGDEEDEDDSVFLREPSVLVASSVQQSAWFSFEGKKSQIKLGKSVRGVPGVDSPSGGQCSPLPEALRTGANRSRSAGERGLSMLGNSGSSTTAVERETLTTRENCVARVKEESTPCARGSAASRLDRDMDTRDVGATPCKGPPDPAGEEVSQVCDDQLKPPFYDETQGPDGSCGTCTGEGGRAGEAVLGCDGRRRIKASNDGRGVEGKDCHDVAVRSVSRPTGLVVVDLEEGAEAQSDVDLTDEDEPSPFGNADQLIDDSEDPELLPWEHTDKASKLLHSIGTLDTPEGALLRDLEPSFRLGKENPYHDARGTHRNLLSGCIRGGSVHVGEVIRRLKKQQELRPEERKRLTCVAAEHRVAIRRLLRTVMLQLQAIESKEAERDEKVKRDGLQQASDVGAKDEGENDTESDDHLKREQCTGDGVGPEGADDASNQEGVMEEWQVERTTGSDVTKNRRQALTDAASKTEETVGEVLVDEGQFPDSARVANGSLVCGQGSASETVQQDSEPLKGELTDVAGEEAEGACSSRTSSQDECCASSSTGKDEVSERKKDSHNEELPCSTKADPSRLQTTPDGAAEALGSAYDSVASGLGIPGMEGRLFADAAGGSSSPEASCLAVLAGAAATGKFPSAGDSAASGTAPEERRPTPDSDPSVTGGLPCATSPCDRLSPRGGDYCSSGRMGSAPSDDVRGPAACSTFQQLGGELSFKLQEALPRQQAPTQRGGGISHRKRALKLRRASVVAAACEAVEKRLRCLTDYFPWLPVLSSAFRSGDECKGRYRPFLENDLGSSLDDEEFGTDQRIWRGLGVTVRGGIRGREALTAEGELTGFEWEGEPLQLRWLAEASNLAASKAEQRALSDAEAALASASAAAAAALAPVESVSGSVPSPSSGQCKALPFTADGFSALTDKTSDRLSSTCLTTKSACPSVLQSDSKSETGGFTEPKRPPPASRSRTRKKRGGPLGISPTRSPVGSTVGGHEPPGESLEIQMVGERVSTSGPQQRVLAELSETAEVLNIARPNVGGRRAMAGHGKSGRDIKVSRQDQHPCSPGVAPVQAVSRRHTTDTSKLKRRGSPGTLGRPPRSSSGKNTARSVRRKSSMSPVASSSLLQASAQRSGHPPAVSCGDNASQLQLGPQPFLGYPFPRPVSRDDESSLSNAPPHGPNSQDVVEPDQTPYSSHLYSAKADGRIIKASRVGSSPHDADSAHPFALGPDQARSLPLPYMQTAVHRDLSPGGIEAGSSSVRPPTFGGQFSYFFKGQRHFNPGSADAAVMGTPGALPHTYIPGVSVNGLVTTSPSAHYQHETDASLYPR